MPLPVSQQWQPLIWPAQIVSRLHPSMKLAEHFVHGVDDRLRLTQPNLVTRSLDEPVYATRREVREGLLQSNPDLRVGSVEPDAFCATRRSEHQSNRCRTPQFRRNPRAASMLEKRNLWFTTAMRCLQRRLTSAETSAIGTGCYSGHPAKCRAKSAGVVISDGKANLCHRGRVLCQQRLSAFDALG